MESITLWKGCADPAGISRWWDVTSTLWPGQQRVQRRPRVLEAKLGISGEIPALLSKRWWPLR